MKHIPLSISLKIHPRKIIFHSSFESKYSICKLCVILIHTQCIFFSCISLLINDLSLSIYDSILAVNVICFLKRKLSFYFRVKEKEKNERLLTIISVKKKQQAVIFCSICSSIFILYYIRCLSASIASGERKIKKNREKIGFS